MFARLLAAFCLVNSAVAWSQSGSELVVYLHSDAGRDSQVVEHMKRELTPMLQSAGYRVQWSGARVETSGALVVLELRHTPDATGILASTSVSQDAILPFVTLNCANLSHLLRSALPADPGPRRDFFYGRAMARVLAHELYHVLANTRDHARAGVGKPQFTASDLLAERFDFEPVTIVRMEAAAVSASESPSGR